MKKDKVKLQGADIFLKAANYIRKYGWQKQGMGKHKQPRCSMGALASAYPKEKWSKDLSLTMYLALYKELHGMSLTEFNYKFNDGNKVASLYEQVAASLVHNNS